MKGITTPLSYEVDTNPFPFSEPSEVPNLSSMRDKSLLHINYFSPYNMNSSRVKSSLAEGSALTAVSDYSAVKDRYTCINLLERMINDFTTTTIKIVDSRNVDDPLDTLKNLYKDHRETHYFVEYYMRDNTWIDLNTFIPEDIFNAMEDAKKQLEYLFYYVAPV
jgi:hypothetical protein